MKLQNILIGNEITGRLKIGELVKYSVTLEDRRDEGSRYLNVVYAGQCKIKDKGIEKDGTGFIKRGARAYSKHIGEICYFEQPLDSISMVGEFIVVDSPRQVDTIGGMWKAMKDFMRFYTKRNKEYSKFDQMLRRHNL